MIDLWLDREIAELDSQQYFDEMAQDDHLIELIQAAQDKDKAVQQEVDRLVAGGSECEIPF